MKYVRSAVQEHTSLMKIKEADFRTQTKKLHSLSKSHTSPLIQVNVLKFGAFLKEPMVQLSES